MLKPTPLILIALALLMAGCFGGGAVESTEGGLIYGTVWSDDTGNGYRDPGEDPVVGRTVLFFPLGSSGEDAALKATTNDYGEYSFDVPEGAQGEICIEPEKQTFTRQNVGDEDLDSDVDQKTGCLSASDGDRVDAGLVPPAAAQAATATATATTAPEPTATAPEPTATTASTKVSQAGTAGGSYVQCSDGLQIPPPTWAAAEAPQVRVDANSVAFSVRGNESSLADQVAMGVDFASQDLPLTVSMDDAALFEGTNVGFSIDPQGNVFAGQTDADGQFLYLESGASGKIENNVYEIVIPASELQAGLDAVRITLTDREICWISGVFEVNYGFTGAAEIDPTLADFLGNIETRRICSSAGCYMLPQDIPYTAAGDGVGSLELDGQTAAAQFALSQGEAGQRAGEFEDVNWIVEPEPAIAPGGVYPWQGLVLKANGGTLGLLGLVDNGSSENALTLEFSLVGQDNLSEARLADWTALMNQILGTSRAVVGFSQ